MQLCEDGLTLAKCELYVLKNEKICGEKWVNFDGKNGDGDGDENDDDDDEIMRNERIHDAIYGSRIKLTLVIMMQIELLTSITK